MYFVGHLVCVIAAPRSLLWMYRYAKIGRPLLGPWLKACDDVVAFFTTASG
jgi:hypothetical protein